MAKLVLANKGFNTEKSADVLNGLIRQPNNLNISIRPIPNANADEIAAAMRDAKFTPQEQSLPIGVPFKVLGFTVGEVTSRTVRGVRSAFMHYEIDGKERAISCRRVLNELPVRAEALNAATPPANWSETSLEAFRKYSADRGTAKKDAAFADPTSEGDVLGALLLKACMESPTGKLVVRDKIVYQQDRQLSSTNPNNAGRHAGEMVTIANDLYIIDVAS